MASKHLDFFKERAREFLIETFLSGNNNPIGLRIRNEFYPALRLRTAAGLLQGKRDKKAQTLVPKSANRKAAPLLSTNQYLDFSVLTDTSPSMLKQRLLT